MTFLKRIITAAMAWLCPQIAANEQLPYGLSISKKHERGYNTDVVRLLLPIGWWRGTDYIASEDIQRHGWWLVTVMIGVLRVPGGFDVRLRAGMWRRGYGRIRKAHIDPSYGSWIDERAYRLWHERREVAAP